MQNIRGIALNDSSREEILPGFMPDFPYIATCVELDKFAELKAPWHWHRSVELFYIQSGSLEYTTPNGRWEFPAGSGGMVNSNVLHTSVFSKAGNNVQLIHLFDPSLLSGEYGSRMGTRYIIPMATAPALEMIPLYPDDPIQAEILQDIKLVFGFSEEEWGYEFRIRDALTRIWMKLFDLVRSAIEQSSVGKASDDKIKKLIVYVHEHYQDPIRVEQLAENAHISKRACFRLFRDNLHMTPVEYIRNYRLQKACQMLAKSKDNVTQIAYSCGLGSSSYFGKVFRQVYGCTPAEYRRQWHDNDINGHQ